MSVRDPLVAGKTLIAAVEPTDPELLDARVLTQAEARVQAAEAARQLALAQVERTRANYDLAESELGRAGRLRENKTIAQSDFDAAASKERSASAELRAAQFSVQIAEFELAQAKAALIHSQPQDATTNHDAASNNRQRRFEVPSPIAGRVLLVFQESATIVSPGTRLVEVGDSKQLEIEIEVLSTDAVKIRDGAKVVLDHWGGEEPLTASVRLVEPSAFTKVSALGVEEQRVYVIADFDGPPEKWQSLGDGYRVEAHVVIWERADVIKIPVGALFRTGDDWTVYAVVHGQAELRRIQAGRNNGVEVEILKGLAEGEQVVVHPSDRIRSGVSVTTMNR